MLRRALQSLVDCEKPFPNEHWEVLVIDNASSDDTSPVARAFGVDLPIRVVFEETLGLSRARNRAMREARGEWILWTDDDVTVTKRWLVAYVEAIAIHSDTSVLGGPITVNFEGSPPRWLSTGVRWVLDAYAGRSDIDFDQPFYARGPKPYGANFGLRRLDAREYPFNPALGHHPLRPTRGGEETAVIVAMLTNRGKGRWVGEAGVTHHIDRSRQSTEYLRSYYVDAGWLSERSGKNLPFARWAARLSDSLAQACINELRYLVLRMLGDQDHWVRRLRDASWHWGRVKGCARELRDAQFVQRGGRYSA